MAEPGVETQEGVPVKSVILATFCPPPRFTDFVPVSEFPLAVVTNHHKRSSLRQYNFILT